jgi:uncharacterized membrane protein
MDKAICEITKQELSMEELTPYSEIRRQLIDLIVKDHHSFSPGKFISTNELNKYRERYLKKLINKENRELNQLEHEVLNAIKHNQILSEDIEPKLESKLTPGQKSADHIADFGGSWTFIIIFFSFLFLWMIINIWMLATKPFDPYPFILLNLILSCLAAIQAPIIMMSQNRKEQKDRARNEHDYKVNLKAELEIRLLNEMVDHMMVHQNKRLLEIQQIQVDYLKQLVKINLGKNTDLSQLE